MYDWLGDIRLTHFGNEATRLRDRIKVLQAKNFSSKYLIRVFNVSKKIHRWSRQIICFGNALLHCTIKSSRGVLLSSATILSQWFFTGGIRCWSRAINPFKAIQHPCSNTNYCSVFAENLSTRTRRLNNSGKKDQNKKRISEFQFIFIIK